MRQRPTRPSPGSRQPNVVQAFVNTKDVEQATDELASAGGAGRLAAHGRPARRRRRRRPERRPGAAWPAVSGQDLELGDPAAGGAPGRASRARRSRLRTAAAAELGDDRGQPARPGSRSAPMAGSGPRQPVRALRPRSPGCCSSPPRPAPPAPGPDSRPAARTTASGRSMTGPRPGTAAGAACRSAARGRSPAPTAAAQRPGSNPQLSVTPTVRPKTFQPDRRKSLRLVEVSRYSFSIGAYRSTRCLIP